MFLMMTLLAAVTPAAGKEVTFSSGGRTLHMHLCKPDGPGPFPAVIYNHGGRGGAIGGAPAQTCEALVKAGFVGISPILRTDVAMEENLRDILAAVDYVKGLEFADPNRIGIMGFSRGGLLAFMAATQRSDFKAIVLMAPAPGRGHAEEALTHSDRVMAPVLLMVAENDLAQANHVQWARRFEGALKAKGKQTRLILYPPYGSDGHRMFFEVGDYWSDVVDFLKRHLV